jgi:hypothetical protein
LANFNSHTPLESNVQFNNIDYYGDILHCYWSLNGKSSEYIPEDNKIYIYT